jgi:hypothetical protein
MLIDSHCDPALAAETVKAADALVALAGRHKNQLVAQGRTDDTTQPIRRSTKKVEPEAAR